MLRPQDASSAPEGEYLATSGVATRREASKEPEYQVVKVRGRPYHLPVLPAAPQVGKGQGGKGGKNGKGGKGGKGANKASEIDLYRTSATVLSEMHEHDPDAIECVRVPPNPVRITEAPGREHAPPASVARGGRPAT